MRRVWIIGHNFGLKPRFMSRGLGGFVRMNERLGIIIQAARNLWPTIVGRAAKRRGRDE